ncbi:MAG: zinc-binding dehydrogenase [Acidimicrobiia bacterium]|nr:zinc-binding dehydrogenase [Acidimicrobiia bacterium]
MTAIKNHRVIVSKRGGPEVLRTIEEDLRFPGRDEVRIKVAAAGISAYDAMLRSLKMPGSPKPPFTPGEDVVGTVDAVGKDINFPTVGTRVATWTFGRGGGYSEHVSVPARHAVPVPDAVDDAQAVTAVVNYLTAHLYLHKTAQARTGESALVHGGAGGLGSALLELGALAGLELYATASEHNHELIRSLGATPIDYREEDFVAEIRRMTGDGVDIVFDPVGGWRQLRRCTKALRPGGRLIPLGSVGTEKSGAWSIPLGLAAVVAAKLTPGKTAPLQPNMMKYPFENENWYRETLEELLDYVAAGKLRPVVAGRFALAEAARAHAALDGGGHAGKLVLTTGH